MVIDNPEKAAALKALQSLIYKSRADNYNRRNGLQLLFNYCVGDMTKTYYKNEAYKAREALNMLREADAEERLVFDYLDGTVLFYENMADGTIIE